MRVVIFGATGSIGSQTIDVIQKNKWNLVGISFYSNISLAKKIKAKYKFSSLHKEHSNVDSYEELIKLCKPDIIVNAIVGFAGLEATLICIKNKITLCLANKESLVVAGKFVMELAKKNNVTIYPIDSEHASIYQILNQTNDWNFKKLYITASGGPFYKYTSQQLHDVTYQQAIRHPTWKMGEKISIDSATLINKCFEIIETYWYFNTKKIEALYEPQSFVHALVEYSKCKLMFASKPNMHLPIYLALRKFRTKCQCVKDYDKSLRLEKINLNKWLPLKWANMILINPNNSMVIILNAINEESIKLFKLGKLKFFEIIPIIDKFLNSQHFTIVNSVDDVYKIDQKARKNFIYFINKV